jgi:hypothetical protein
MLTYPTLQPPPAIGDHIYMYFNPESFFIFSRYCEDEYESIVAVEVITLIAEADDPTEALKIR